LRVTKKLYAGQGGRGREERRRATQRAREEETANGRDGGGLLGGGGEDFGDRREEKTEDEEKGEHTTHHEDDGRETARRVPLNHSNQLMVRILHCDSSGQFSSRFYPSTSPIFFLKFTASNNAES